ncbi:LytR/AlgR family response regulator transcription factor [Sphingobacterium faecium]|uniref:LytR/AlgR family response regulator transcription factor n=1 Tax=Sphingobacterium faecium TaxID=34087 RepID=UPI00246955A8|nr:LytTR family DNA-binding domain-containing protein [Sphingobacterium faecium]MDH5826421.1 LytTR family DNA-binding domain-containing protein [Sphingobacterium faecium]
MPKYTIVVIDDNKADADCLVKHLREIDDVGPIEVFNDGVSGAKHLLKNKPDILFLDIEMPDISGLELYALLPEKDRPALVLVSAHTEFALDGFKLAAVDYLLKPVKYAEVTNSFIRCLKSMNISVNIYTQYELEYYLFEVKDGNSRIVHFKNIIYITSVENYAEIVTRDEVITARITMDKIESIMPKSYFVRIHRGYIVNFRFALEVKGSKLIVSEGTETELPISRSRKNRINRLDKLE